MKKFALILITTMSSLYASQPNSLRDSYHPAVKGGFDIWIDVDLLYWKPWERALVATNKQSDVFVTDDFTEAPLEHPHFNWDWGYRVSAGYLFSSNHWTVEASWTHFTSRASQHRSSHGSAFLGMFPIWSLSDDVIAGDYVFESDLKWKLTINMLDLQFERYFKPCHWLELSPFIGLRSAWIKQGGHVVYEGGMFLIGIFQPGVSLNGSDFIEMQNNYWGMGPRVGIDPRIVIYKGFSINTEAAISCLYGFFNVRQKETYLESPRFSHHEHLNRFRWIGDLSAGVQWKTLFNKERYALTFKADWEYHIFFNQFQLKRDDFGLVPDNRTLSTQGVTFSGRFDF
ncbi:MAG: hypothetical protein JSR39_02880 [Verrucomicrobia bacterium]|nr:hypothetical protein [Verrucomicrobiota bacterium]